MNLQEVKSGPINSVGISRNKNSFSHHLFGTGKATLAPISGVSYLEVPGRLA